MLTRFKEKFAVILDWLYRLLEPLNLPPNAVTLAGLAACFAGYAALRLGFFELLVALFALSCLADALDGYIARKRNAASTFGAFLDSVTDRIEDAVFGIALYDIGLLSQHEAFFLITGFFMVSYARSRGESLGVPMAGVGFAERAERLVLIFLALLLSRFWWAAARATVLVLFAATYFTVLQRVAHAYKQLRVRRA
ncbi:MAG: CDP-alcohol phosphatidyltransferase family protein [Thermofilum sp.]|uniref:CDP-alcohol phosphatidyltransferase family protein n=1 Tax=Thermofilum pendens TaxID=2269 RepID=A0A7C4H3R9_THEPE